MTLKQVVKPAVTLGAVGLVFLGGMFISSQRAHADASSGDTPESQEIEIGLKIAPVRLNMTGKDSRLVGLGSFIVNGQADCNGCHTSDPTREYKDPGNPFFNQHPTIVNPDTYLAGGNNFGPVGGGIVNGVPGPGPDIITRNLTPDHTGLPEGGHSFGDFLTIMRTGKDFDHLHPNCSGAPTPTTNCYFSVPGNEIDGDLLQIMPWPTFSNMTDHQLLAIWTYLSAIPCNANKNSPYPWVRNVC
jgi:hypothetical protein